MEGADLILDLVNGHRRSKVLFAAVELGIIDIIHEARPGGINSEDISNAIAVANPQLVSKLDERTTEGESVKSLSSRDTSSKTFTEKMISRGSIERLLEACVAIGIIRAVNNELPRCYTLEPASVEYLVSTSPNSMAGYVIHSNRVVYPLFTHLETCVTSGKNAWDLAFGMPSGQVFANMYQSEEGLLRFMTGMHSFAKLSARQVLTAFDLSPFQRAMDLGGATGAFMTTLAELQPGCHCTVVDLPNVIDAATRHFLRPPFVENTSVLSRISWQAADFFEALDPDAKISLPLSDLYILTRILHDWDEDRCIKLLSLVYNRMGPGNALLIGEMLLYTHDEDKVQGRLGEESTLLQDLNMLVQTHGRERSFKGYQMLLSQAGFETTKMNYKRTGAYLNAIIAFK